MLKQTQTAVDAFQPPRGKADHLEFFDGAPGFGLRIRDGRRTFFYQYKLGKQHRRIKLGDAAKVKFAAAKDAMSIHAGEIAKGRDPAKERQEQRDREATARQDRLQAKAAKTLLQHVPDYLEYVRPMTKPRSFVEIERLLTKDYWTDLHGLPLPAIELAAVASQLKSISKQRGGSAANHARIALSSFFRWAIGEGLCKINPVTGTNKPAVPASRDRVLDDAELAAVWTGAPEAEYGIIVRLLTLTGQRRDEIGSLRWSEIHDLDKPDRARIVLPGKTSPDGADGLRTKNGWQHEIPLSAAAAALLKGISRRGGRDLVFGEGEGGFSGWSKAKEALDAKLGKAVQPWRLHDLRRTAATRLADGGTLPHVIEAVLNHISGHKAGVAGIYNRAAYAAEKRAALDTLATYIKTASAKANGANVTRLPQRA